MKMILRYLISIILLTSLDFLFVVFIAIERLDRLSLINEPLVSSGIQRAQIDKKNFIREHVKDQIRRKLFSSLADRWNVISNEGDEYQIYRKRN